MSEIEAKRKELEGKLNRARDTDEFWEYDIRLKSFNLGVEMARKEFIKDMVFLLSKYFQSIGNENFKQMEGDYSWNLFCNECYKYLQSLEENKK